MRFFPVFAATMMVATTGYAQDGSNGQVWWQVLLSTLLQVLTPVIVAVIGILINRLVKSEQNRKIIKDAIAYGVGYAEEAARKALKDGSPISSDDKLAMALDQAAKFMSDNGITDYAKDKLTSGIEALLGMTRLMDSASEKAS